MAGVLKGMFSGIAGAAKNIGAGFKTAGSAALKPLRLSSGSYRSVKMPRTSGGRSFKAPKLRVIKGPNGKSMSVGPKYSGTFSKADRKAAASRADARRASAKSNGKPMKLKRLPSGTAYRGNPGDRKKLKPGDKVKLKPLKHGSGGVLHKDGLRWDPSSKGLARPQPGINAGVHGAGNLHAGADRMPYGANDPYGGLSPQQMKQAGFASAQEYAQDAERKARNALRSTPASGVVREEKGHYGMKTPDFSLRIGGRNRLDPADRDFINEQRDKTHRHKREEFDWKQAPKDRKADRHWNLINTGKVVYRDGKANSDVGAINRELHRDRSLEAFERKFNREWNKRMRTSYYSALSPAEQEAARQDLYSRMRNNHDRSYSIGRAVAGWNADRKAERKQKKEDARNLKNIRLLRGWY